MAELSLDVVREGDELHRIALEQQVDRTANQVQTLIEATAAQTIQRLNIEASRRQSAQAAADSEIGNSAVRAIQEVVVSPGFSQ